MTSTPTCPWPWDPHGRDRPHRDRRAARAAGRSGPRPPLARPAPAGSPTQAPAAAFPRWGDGSGGVDKLTFRERWPPAHAVCVSVSPRTGSA